MTTPILSTKLYIPLPPPKAVSRPRLLERLNAGLHYHRKVSLISAPAGFGKTTLVSEWLAGGARPVAWLSLDEGDSDPVRFLTYLVAALQKIAANLGAGILSAFQSPQLPPTEMLLTTLLNEISALPDDFVLVLDDYHVIESKVVDEALGFLVEHLPPQLHLVITTRQDPALPLARLRARNQITELRGPDLRFTPAETTEFLKQVMGLELRAEEIAALEERTEGWVAGLQLAALSMQNHRDIAGFIRGFAGDHRYILDYLVEEVLRRQPESVRRFLLQTAILDQLHGPLCEAVTGQEEGQARLEHLERGNFFVVTLDDKRQWYRYHHLFAEVLQARLMAEYPALVATLHQRASEWYKQNDMAARAIHHALAAKDFERAAGLVERAVPQMRRSRQEVAVLGWLRALPNELIQVRPILSVAYAWTLLATGQFEEVETHLREAERWLGTTVDPSAQAQLESGQRMVVSDPAELPHLPGVIAVYRAVLAQTRGNVLDTVKYARQALDFFPEEDQLGRGAAAALLGLASWVIGDLETAYQTYANGMTRLIKAGNVLDAIGGTSTLADIRRGQGRLGEAMQTYERALQLATEQETGVLRGTADLYVGMSELYLERNDLQAAANYLRLSNELGEPAGLPQNPYRWRVAMARLKSALEDLTGALDLLQEAEQVYASDFSPNVRPIAALKAQLWVRQGGLDKAFGWAREQGLTVRDDLSYPREFEYLTFARLLLAHFKSDQADQSSLREAIGLLEGLVKAAQAGERLGSVIEILIVQALAHQLQGDLKAALRPLQEALTLAEPEGYVRIFVDEGPAMAVLLEEAAKRGISPNYIQQLRAAFGKAEDRPPTKEFLIIEPLSERELEVLRLLRTELNGPEMARELSVSLNTLRTHTKNIYAKLDVNNRRAALRRAEELDLL